MSLHRTPSLLAAWTLVFLAAVPALGQTLEDMQLFAPADMATYGGGYRPNEGFFFSFEQLVWWIQHPDRELIGDATTRRVVINEQVYDGDGDDDDDDDDGGDGDGGPPPGWEPEKVIEFSTHDTGVLLTEEAPGQRYEFGYVQDHSGWLCSIFKLGKQGDRITASDAHVVFQDAPFDSPPRYHLQGYIDSDLTLIDDLPVKFDELEAEYEVETWGVELNYLHRMHPNHCGGMFEWFFGVRYLEFDDQFDVVGIEYIAEGEDEDTEDPANGLGDSAWFTTAENHVIGPQIGLRWFRKCSRWTWSAEGRFFSGFNLQNVHLEGNLGSNLDPENAGLLEIRNMAPTSFNHTRHFDEWSPGVELRLDLRYQLTRALSVKVGWTGFWIDRMARAPSLIDYSIGQSTVMGITGNDNGQDVLINGVNVGIEMNR